MTYRLNRPVLVPPVKFDINFDYNTLSLESDVSCLRKVMKSDNEKVILGKVKSYM